MTQSGHGMMAGTWNVLQTAKWASGRMEDEYILIADIFVCVYTGRGPRIISEIILKHSFTLFNESGLSIKPRAQGYALGSFQGKAPSFSLHT